MTACSIQCSYIARQWQKNDLAKLKCQLLNELISSYLATYSNNGYIKSQIYIWEHYQDVTKDKH